MSNIIQFLESMGKDASLSNLSSQHYAAAVAELGLNVASQQALLDRDHQALNQLLGGREEVRCMLVTPEAWN